MPNWRLAVCLAAALGLAACEDFNFLTGPSDNVSAPSSILGATLTLRPDTLIDANCGWTSANVRDSVTTFVDRNTIRTRNVDGSFDSTSTNVNWTYDHSGPNASVYIAYANTSTSEWDLQFTSETRGDLTRMLSRGGGCFAEMSGTFSIRF